MITTSTAPLASAGATGSIPITSPGVAAGTSGLSVYAGPPNAAQLGAYLTPSPDFVGGFVLQRHMTGFRAGPTDAPQTVALGDDVMLKFAFNGPLASLSGMYSVSLVLTALTAGNIVLSVVQ